MENNSHSDFWLQGRITELDFVNSDRSNKSSTLMKLASVKCAISNFVKILTEVPGIKVKYNTNGESHTDGKTVTIGTNAIKPEDFDFVVGLALHEASHIKLTDFYLFTSIATSGINYIPKPLLDRICKVRKYDLNNALMSKKLNEVISYRLKTLVNIIEDRRIDYYVYNTAPGYRGYYESLYNEFFNTKEINKSLKLNMFVKENWKCYDFHLTHFTNINRNLSSLKGLQEIWNILDLKNINRLKSTHQVLDLSIKIYSIIENHVLDEIEAQHNTNKPKPDKKHDKLGNSPSGTGNGQQGETEEPKQSPALTDDEDEENDTVSMPVEDTEQGENEQDKEDNETNDSTEDIEQDDNEVDTKESKSDDVTDDSDVDDNDEVKEEEPDTIEDGEEYDYYSETDEEEDNYNVITYEDLVNNGDGTGKLTDKEVEVLRKTLQEIKEFIEDKIDKKKLSKTDSSAVDGLASTSNDIIQTNNENIKSGVKTIVIKRVTDEFLESNPFGTLVRDNNKSCIEAGVTLGKMLGNKIQIRNDERTLVYTRLPKGRLDNRLVAGLGYDQENVFNNRHTEKFKPVLVHISIDASGSMNGSKWNNTIMSVTAICKAASMVKNLNVTVNFRGTTNIGNNDGDPIVIFAYDSRKDKFNVLKNNFTYFAPNSATPEGLCFEAMRKCMDILNTDKNVDNYFINFSDGEPCYRGYIGTNAVEHTRKEVELLRKSGYEILSYFITSPERSTGVDQSNFKRMYGKDASFIKPTELNALAKSLNKMFLKKDY